MTISGSENTGDWAQETVALAIREGVVLAGETIDPTAPVTREEAALFLYRLFMLLEEVRPVAIEMDIEEAVLEEVALEEESEGLSQGVIMALAGLVIVAVPTAVFVPKLIKKRNG